jgi:hypothetical protein
MRHSSLGASLKWILQRLHHKTDLALSLHKKTNIIQKMAITASFIAEQS